MDICKSKIFPRRKIGGFFEDLWKEKENSRGASTWISPQEITWSSVIPGHNAGLPPAECPPSSWIPPWEKWGAARDTDLRWEDNSRLDIAERAADSTFCHCAPLNATPSHLEPQHPICHLTSMSVCMCMCMFVNATIKKKHILLKVCWLCISLVRKGEM